MQEKIAKLGEFPAFAGFFFGDVEPDRPSSTAARRCSRRRARRSPTLEPFTAEAIEAALRGDADGSG